MMDAATYLGFLALVLAVLLTPGPSVTLGIVHGMADGARRAAFTVLGDISANMLQMIAAVAGLGLILAQSATLFLAIKIAGVAYLAWLGFRMIRRSFRVRPPVEVAAQGAPRSRWWHFRQGFIVAGTSPKAILFYGALFPQFIDPAAPLWSQFAILAITCAILDFWIVWGYAALAALGARRFAGAGGAWIDRIGGIMMLGAAAWLARAQR
ncbi:LysE family translocator [Roseovarius aquimarinus]|uniref:LysE family translocator n=1 Tax=Roseovarius aquimarinus TaxID=1229156 RepID=A0ABW7I5N9_9RHOB